MSTPQGWKLEQSDGVGPFVSRIVYRLPDGELYTWTSRRHRKGFALEHTRTNSARTRKPRGFALWTWAPRRLGWWIGVLFLIGSACFAAASLGGAAPESALGGLFRSATIANATFFAGSIFFTSAAFLQLLEAVNADRQAALARGERAPDRFRWFAWQPNSIGWMSSAIQLAGTILFNFNTLDAMLTGSDWLRQDLLVWTPDMVGSVCFLVASWLALLEFCHGYWSWKPGSISWWVVAINLLGSVAFMASAMWAVAGPAAATPLDSWLVSMSTFVGAVCFLVGAYLLVPEIAVERSDSHSSRSRR